MQHTRTLADASSTAAERPSVWHPDGPRWLLPDPQPMRMHSSVFPVVCLYASSMCLPLLPVVFLIRQPLSLAARLHAIPLAVGHALVIYWAYMLEYTGHTAAGHALVVYWAYMLEYTGHTGRWACWTRAPISSSYWLPQPTNSHTRNPLDHTDTNTNTNTVLTRTLPADKFP